MNQKREYVCKDYYLQVYMNPAAYMTERLNDMMRDGWIAQVIHFEKNLARVVYYRFIEDKKFTLENTEVVAEGVFTNDWNDIPGVNTRPQDGMSYINNEIVNRTRGFEFL